MLHVLFADEECARALCFLVNDIGNGVVSGEASMWLRSAVEIMVPKPNGGFRPVVICKPLKKLAESYRLSFCPVSELFPTIQLGVGASAGNDAAVHLTQAALELRIGGPNTIAINHDVTNAFNTIDRTAVANSIFAEPRMSDVWHLFHWQHSAPSLLLAFDENNNLHTAINSTQGVQQGSSVSSVAFALAVQPAYEKAMRSAAPAEGTAVATAILDDFTIVGSPATCFEVTTALKRELAALSLSLNCKKTVALWPNTTAVPAEVEQGVEQLGLRLARGHAPLLGAFIGHDDDAIATACFNSLDDYKPTFDALSNNKHLPHHLSYIFARLCHQPILNHKARTMRPQLLRRTAERFDRDVRAPLLEHADIEPVNATQDGLPFLETQLGLPLRHGGLGLRPYADHIAPAAYVASLLQSLHHLAPLIQQHQATFAASDARHQQLPHTPMFTAFNSEYLQHMQAFATLCAHDRTRGRQPRRDALALPESPHDLLAVYGQPPDGNTLRIQRILTSRLDEVKVLQLDVPNSNINNSDMKGEHQTPAANSQQAMRPHRQPLGPALLAMDVAGTTIAGTHPLKPCVPPVCALPAWHAAAQRPRDAQVLPLQRQEAGAADRPRQLRPRPHLRLVPQV